ncbi:DUF551 domain-containing protein [Enterobacter sp. MGH85]|uniref:DUF551 domain-containing protein n=1 Tax=Enterobacter sp. MGH85 TaxID=1686389 RepID=UPI0006518FA8|nr:DUF551 domain-containing protein [Enterobacter sp. MGH85]KLW32591.1 hypothetical protein SK51_04264 [Enterobacter sp. MGH85]
MSTFTKEQLIEKLQHRISVASGFPESEKAQMDLELARIALASLEAEPAIHRWRRVTAEPYGPYPWHYGNFICFSKPVDGIEDEYYYAAPPAPVSVPDERYQHLSELYHAQEKRLFKLAQRIKGASFDKYAYSPSQAIDVLESAIFGEREDECRAAMLQGAELVSNRDELPDGWVACSERMPEKADEVLCAKEFDGPGDWRQKVGYYLAGKWTVYSASWTPTHWMPLPAAPQQEADNE